MDKNTLYRFFEGIASYEEEEAVRIWLATSPDNQKILLEERKVFDAILLLGRRSSQQDGEPSKTTDIGFSTDNEIKE